MICLVADDKEASILPYCVETMKIFDRSNDTKRKWIIEHFENIEPPKPMNEQLKDFFDLDFPLKK